MHCLVKCFIDAADVYLQHHAIAPVADCSYQKKAGGYDVQNDLILGGTYREKISGRAVQYTRILGT